MSVTLDESQSKALQIINTKIKQGQKKISLAGVAGTGKTTLMKEVLQTTNKKTLLLSPTGKAAVRLKEVVKKQTHTIHSALYGGAEEDESGNLVWLDPQVLTTPNSLIIVDEASMVSLDLAVDLQNSLPSSSNILYVGDPFQVPPVNAEPGVDLNNPDALLDKVHRQAQDNPVLQLATNIRLNNWVPYLKNYNQQDQRLQKHTGVDKLVTNYVKDLQAQRDSTAICYTNENRRQINSLIHSALGHKAKLTVGTKLVVKANNKKMGVYNGEVFVIEKVKTYNHALWGLYAAVKFVERSSTFMIRLASFGNSQSEWRAWTGAIRRLPTAFILVDYGYCLTTHTSQGSEWDVVHYHWEPLMSKRYLRPNNSQDLEETNRMFYTAVTRTSNQLNIYR